MTRSFPFVIVIQMPKPAVPAATSRIPPGASDRSPSHPDELLALTRATADGDPDAAATLILQLGGSILRVVRRVFGASHPDVDDVAQEATLAVLAALPSFRGDSSVLHFANRVSLLTALGARRKTRAIMRKAQEEARPLDDVISTASSPHQEAVSRQRRELVRELLDDLSEPVAEALALHFMLGYSVEEIALALELSPHTVWSRLRLGKHALRRRLERNSDLRETLEYDPEENAE